jgi:hypothetical protein
MMVYAHAVMKRLQILIDEELASELERAAASSGRSKSALIREYVRQHLSPLPPLERDPLFRLTGKASFDPAPVDDVVYGERKRASRRAVARPRP